MIKIKPFEIPAIFYIYGDVIREASDKYGVRKSLIAAVIRQESGGNPVAEGVTGDFGLMQITAPCLSDFNRINKTHYSLFPDMFSPSLNINVGSWYLSWLYGQLKDWQLAVQAYNAGIGAVKKDSAQGKQYAQSVFAFEQEYQRGNEYV